MRSTSRTTSAESPPYRSNGSNRGLLTASVLAFPVLLGAGAFVVLVGALCGWHPFWQEPELTLSEAAALKDRATIRRLIADGADPNAPARVRAGVIDDDEMVLTPLQASVATRTPDAMRMLLAAGARMDARERAVVTCLAIKDDAQEILQFLEKAGAFERPDCEDVATPW